MAKVPTRIIGNVKHDGVLLEEYEVYAIEEEDAKKLVKAGNAKILPDYPAKKIADYIPQTVKVDPKTGMRVPGETVAAKDETAGVKGVEQPQNDVKGDDDNGKGQEQTKKGKKETEEK